MQLKRFYQDKGLKLGQNNPTWMLYCDTNIPANKYVNGAILVVINTLVLLITKVYVYVSDA